MSWWTNHMVPRLVDASLSQRPVMERRESVCAGLEGRVIEVGFGSGLNLAALPPAVTAVDAVEPCELAWARSARRRERATIPVERIGLDGRTIAADDATYDAALVTFSLCTIPEPERALAELHRVLRPGAPVHFLEHAAAPDAGVRTWQRRLEPMQRTMCGGCHLTRDPVALAQASDFEVEVAETGYLGLGPARVWTYLVQGRATRS